MSAPTPGLFSTDQPLAARMRPRSIDEFIGQEHILGPGRLLRRAIEADQLSSIILYGPPGTGKTTLARVIANSTRAHFIALNAVLGGVKEIREAVAEAQQQQRLGRRTILFIDEVHRFNKAQQDALLPWVEHGTVTLIGATTENPYFEVNKALMSRSRVFQLKPLGQADLRQVVCDALADRQRGYGQRNVTLEEDGLEHFINVANGDARSLLNALELAVETTEPDQLGHVLITRRVAEESIQQRAVLYDKEGDAHFDTISAFIKSVRGSDPDAALYWLAKMVYAGEDPRFIFRRLLILASEDIGLADPHALVVVSAAAQAYDYVGLPEGRYHLAHATIYLATTAKSNSTLGFFDALDVVGREREGEVPNHLRDGNRDAEGFGHGAGYAYPHAYREHWVAQQYLPDALQAKVFYQPSDQGYEAGIRADVERRREAQLAAMLEQGTPTNREVLSFSPLRGSGDRWLERTVSEAGNHAAELRELMMEAAALQRHSLVLDIAAASGLLLWEAVRRTPEGQVWAAVSESADLHNLEQQSARLEALRRPAILAAAPLEVAARVRALDSVIAFDAIFGRQVASRLSEPNRLLSTLAPLLRPGGVLVLAENDRSRSQRLSELVDWGGDEALRDRVNFVEEELYSSSDRWGDRQWEELCAGTRWRLARLHELPLKREQRITPHLLNAWLNPETEAGRYARALQAALGHEGAEAVEHRYRQALTNRSVAWRSVVVVAELRLQP